MKKGIFFITAIVLFLSVIAQDKLTILKNDNSIITKYVSAIDSILFTNSQTEMTIYNADKSTESYVVTDVKSVNISSVEDVVNIVFAENSATITNPFESIGVLVTQTGANVVVNSSVTDKKITYRLSGTSSNGNFKLYSNADVEIQLNSLDLTNNLGSAINVQSKFKTSVLLLNSSVNNLSDGIIYTTTTTGEDEKSTLFTEGQVEFAGSGTLNIKSLSKHAICSDAKLFVNGGNINVSASAKDGIHAQKLIQINKGTVSTTTTGDGIDCELGDVEIQGGTIVNIVQAPDTKGISADYNLLISGGTITQTISGDQSKGIKSTQNMTISGGKTTINTSGSVILQALTVGYDPSYCSAIKCDSDLVVSGGEINITATGKGGKGISVDNNFTYSNAKLTTTISGAGAVYVNSLNKSDSYSSTCVSIDGNSTVLSGTMTLNTTSAASGGKTFSANGTITIGDQNQGPTLTMTTAGARFLVSGSDYSHPKTLVSDKAIVINNGTNILISTDDGIHSDVSVTINGGNTTVTATSSTQGVGEGVEAPLIYFNGGTNTVTASNDGVNATYGTVSGGTESNDNSHLYITGGLNFISATNGDAIDSNGNVTITGGVTFANGPASGVEEAIDFNGNCLMNGGTFIGAGSNSNMTKAFTSSSTQANFYITSSSQISSSTMMTVAINGTGVISFKPKYGAYKFLISSPQMTKGASYVIYTGGTYSGGNGLNNYYSGGSYSNSGATTKKSGTLSSSATLNTITF